MRTFIAWLLLASVVSGAYPTPTARYKLQDDAASTTIVATQGTNLTLAGGDNTEDITTTGPGDDITKALTLNGTDDEITHTTEVTDGTTTKLSACCWLKCSDFDTADQYLISDYYGVDAGKKWGFFSGSTGDDGALGLRLSSDGGTTTNNVFSETDQGSLSEVAWVHVGFSYDGTTTTVKFFINGTEEGVDSGTVYASLFDSSTADFRIGNIKGSSYFYDGSIADVCVWDDTVLTESQIQEVMAEGEDGTGALLFQQQH